MEREPTSDIYTTDQGFQILHHSLSSRCVRACVCGGVWVCVKGCVWRGMGAVCMCVFGVVECMFFVEKASP